MAIVHGGVGDVRDARAKLRVERLCGGSIVSIVDVLLALSVRVGATMGCESGSVPAHGRSEGPRIKS